MARRRFASSSPPAARLEDPGPRRVARGRDLLPLGALRSRLRRLAGPRAIGHRPLETQHRRLHRRGVDLQLGRAMLRCHGDEAEGGVLARLRRALGGALALAPERFHVYQHVPPRAGACARRSTGSR